MDNEVIETQEEEKECSKKIKNLISLSILLLGLFIGSLFVDFVQYFKGTGFSQKALSNLEVIEAGGKTWVAYEEPVVNIDVITDENCEKCDPGEFLVWLRKIVPTMNVNKISFDSKAGKALIDKFQLKTTPSFVFSSSVENTEFFTQAKALFDEKEKMYKLRTLEIGLEPGRYLDVPSIQEGDAVFGNKESKVKVVIFSDYQCPFCRVFYKTFTDILKQYQDKVLFDYKHLALDIHPQARNAALAAECALEQNKFLEYGQKLYDLQNDWGTLKGTQKFKDYARNLGLKTEQFNQCLDTEKYKDKVEADRKEAESFGVSGTPAIFVGETLKAGAVTTDDFKKLLDEALNK